MIPMKPGMGGMGGGMTDAPAPDEAELDSDAKIEAIRSALKDLVDLVGGITVEDAKARKAAPPPPKAEEPPIEEE